MNSLLDTHSLSVSAREIGHCDWLLPTDIDNPIIIPWKGVSILKKIDPVWAVQGERM